MTFWLMAVHVHRPWVPCLTSPSTGVQLLLQPGETEGGSQPVTERSPLLLTLDAPGHQTPAARAKGKVKKFILNRLVESSINFYPTHPLVPLWTISN